jgi:hypothetical protein
MATEYVTNVVVSPHNTWTLIKHVAGSVNKAAAKTDAIVYGTQVKVEVKEKPVDHPVLTVLGIILGAVICFVIFIGYITGNVKGRDFIGF